MTLRSRWLCSPALFAATAALSAACSGVVQSPSGPRADVATVEPDGAPGEDVRDRSSSEAPAGLGTAICAPTSTLVGSRASMVAGITQSDWV